MKPKRIPPASFAETPITDAATVDASAVDSSIETPVAADLPARANAGEPAANETATSQASATDIPAIVEIVADAAAPVIAPAGNAPPSEDLDIDRVEADAGPVRRLERCNADRGKGFAVVIQRSALDAMHEHGRADTTVEVCGVLVGEVRHDRISPYLLITHHIAGDKASSKQTQVTFTVETWNMVQAEMESKHVGKKVVGWYHTHPGFGVFLSGMDLFIQDNFFNLAWQVAWVYDPIAETDGVFVWKLGKSVKADFLIEENAGHGGHDFRAGLAAGERPSVIVARKRTRRERLANLALLTLVFVACFGIIWYLMGWMSDHGFRVRLPIER